MWQEIGRPPRGVSYAAGTRTFGPDLILSLLDEAPRPAPPGGALVPSFEPGGRFGHYELVAHLARGGMAEVWLARRSGALGFSRRVAIKTVRPELAGAADVLRAFQFEALVAGRMCHPHIVQVFDVDYAAGRPFLAMEYVPGYTLRQIGRTYRTLDRLVPPWVTLRVLGAVCEGLHYLHELCDEERGDWLGLAHGDVSPENVMVAQSGAVKLLDFGLTMLHGLSRSGARARPRYRAPELDAGRLGDRRVDVYAVGAILYEFITGYRPEPGRSLTPDTPLARVIRRAMAAQPEQRYPDAQTLGRELQAVAAAYYPAQENLAAALTPGRTSE